MNNTNKYNCHSGGCAGADTCWEKTGEKYGVLTHAYSFGNHVQESKNQVILSHLQLSEGFEHVKIAAITLKKSVDIPYAYTRNLLARNWFQVKNSTAIFAIGKFEGANKKFVNGGTGWAVQMAVDNKKEIFFFDQVSSNWYRYDYKQLMFTVIDYIPKLTVDFAGIGTRELLDNGISAISNVYAETFMSADRKNF